jgi:hypothetical protein
MKREKDTSRFSEGPAHEPTPLVTGDGPASEVLRAALDDYRGDLDESAAWRRVAPRLKSRAVPQLGMYLAFGLAAGVAFLLLGKPKGSIEQAPGPVAVAPLPAPSPVVGEEAAPTDEPLVRPTVLPRPLREGRSRLSDGSVVRVASASDASVRARPEEGTTIELARGRVDLEIAPQAAEHRVEVVSGVYHFVALGTQFHVTAASDRVEVEVVEGTVGVFSGTKLLARVERGSSWSSAAPPRADVPSEPVPHPGNTPPQETTSVTKESAVDAADCSALGRTGNTQAALDCYGRQSQKTGMSGELALYEIARLRKDVLSDYAGALEALKTYDTRFPNGSLRGEVQMSRVEILGRLGRNDEALSESARLLDTPWGKERASDLHLLRGNLYRHSLRDFARAEAEYAHLSDERGPAGDEAQFQRAFCLERLGQNAAALGLYQSYLKRPHPRHAAEAQARIQAFLP